MTLVAGSRLGPYEIVAPLGAGGMGEVYRARDSRLGREVAIKVLPASFSADPDRLRRFEHEAKAAGLLNHPNITAVYDIGTHDGAPYVVHELLEGETLRAELAGGRFLPRTAIDYALQIARGLAAAHEKGIVHRDLKPENVFVTKDGRIKILDFGLAKLTQAEQGGQATSLPTATAGTEPGVVMGTLGYMSPEQVKGKAADARSDIFSFGAILYEMLAGRRAFQGDSAAETMSAILREEPPDLSVTNQSISPGLERIVRHCLEKNLERRFQSARDLAFDLEAASELSGPRLEPSPLAAGWRRPGVGIAAVIAIATTLAGLLAGRVIWKASAISSPSFHRLTYRRGFVSSGRFAPDGQTVFYAASWDGAAKPQLFSTRVENPGSLRLGLPDGHVESISRSGEMLILSNVVFGGGYTHRGTLSSAPLSGAAARDLLEDVADADWFPDGQSFAIVRAPQWRYRLEFPAGKVIYETTGWISHPRVSPTGDAVAFLDHPLFGDDLGSLAIVDQSGKKRTLSTGWESTQGLAWSASGDEIWFTASGAGSGRALYAVTRSGRRRLIASSPGVLTLQDISKDGRVLIDHANERAGLLGLSAADAKERDLSGLDWSRGPILSEDGKTLVFTEQGAGGGAGYSVYLRKMDGSPAVRLGEGNAWAISPDGKWVLAALVRSPPISLVLLPSGAGESRPLPKDSINHNGAASFFLDGRRIIFVGSEPGHARRCWLQDLDGGKPRPVSPEGVVGTVPSPDGRFVVARGPDQKPALYPVEGGPPRPIEGSEPSDRPLRWSADGKSLFVVTRDRNLTARVYRVEVPGGRREVWKEFAPRDPTGLTDFYADAITPDGRTLVFAYHHILSDLYVVEGLK
jgi:serine/threonine protein kinase/Tol biopolymer transport system component